MRLYLPFLFFGFLGLTSCTFETCEDRGQKTVFTGFMTIPVYIGNTLTFQLMPIYDCAENK